ncbi:hypothetical protein FCIRC_11922 [Fusarium circinatum]|uniref:Uncharacterized protein n=1 Tax=Fusarium circinatum TaxID=48490 RepID=A0A8H5SWD1_FUSCI|nr:hypothetical protein FCIRC_11922 [Fusarium circinatum]
MMSQVLYCPQDMVAGSAKGPALRYPKVARWNVNGLPTLPLKLTCSVHNTATRAPTLQSVRRVNLVRQHRQTRCDISLAPGDNIPSFYPYPLASATLDDGLRRHTPTVFSSRARSDTAIRLP